MSFTKLLVACLAAGTLSAPAATAEHPTFDCDFVAAQVGAVSQTYEGVAWGYVAQSDEPTATIRCYVTVDGWEVSSTGAGVGATAGPVSYTSSAGSTVQVCAEAFLPRRGQTVTKCLYSSITPVVDGVVAEVRRIVRDIGFGIVDPLVCGVLVGLSGTYGNVTIGSDGDVYVDGEPVRDCPPYQHFPPG